MSKGIWKYITLTSSEMPPEALGPPLRDAGEEASEGGVAPTGAEDGAPLTKLRNPRTITAPTALKAIADLSSLRLDICSWPSASGGLNRIASRSSVARP
jgi:hypothetical protein